MRYLLTLMVVSWIPALASAQTGEGQKPSNLPPIVQASATVGDSTYPYPWNQDEAQPADEKASKAVATESVPTETVATDVIYDEGACCSDECCGLRGRIGCPVPCWHWCEEPIMESHMWYIADPKMYYYFRPYNYAHVFMQQHEATQMGISPKNPYSNAIFQDVYARLKKEDEEARAGK